MKYYTRYPIGHNLHHSPAVELGSLIRDSNGRWTFQGDSDHDFLEEYAVYEIDPSHPEAREVMAQVPFSNLQSLGDRIDSDVKRRRRLAEEHRAARRRENERRSRASMSVKLGDLIRG
ncbi:MAG: hypothetical protein LAT68_15795 [Cyclobacteriaceae bacterium]|nr:hypothetical protein [Cyclobacteriaceae bacterium]